MRMPDHLDVICPVCKQEFRLSVTASTGTVVHHLGRSFLTVDVTVGGIEHECRPDPAGWENEPGDLGPLGSVTQL